MNAASTYPITLVELRTYSADADKIFDWDWHERLKEILAFNPEHGETIKGTDGVRQFIWKIQEGGQKEVQVVYFFHDLEIPLFLVAICEEPFEEFDADFCVELKNLSHELVEEYQRQKALLVQSRGTTPA